MIAAAARQVVAVIPANARIDANCFKSALNPHVIRAAPVRHSRLTGEVVCFVGLLPSAPMLSTLSSAGACDGLDRQGASATPVEITPLTHDDDDGLLMQMKGETVSCGHCGAQWKSRVDFPLRCPRCWLPLKNGIVVVADTEIAEHIAAGDHKRHHGKEKGKPN